MACTSKVPATGLFEGTLPNSDGLFDRHWRFPPGSQAQALQMDFRRPTSPRISARARAASAAPRAKVRVVMVRAGAALPIPSRLADPSPSFAGPPHKGGLLSIGLFCSISIVFTSILRDTIYIIEEANNAYK